MFESVDKLILGLFSGILFGVLLQKGQVGKFQVILGQMLLKNWVVLKIMSTAIIVGAVGVYLLLQNGLAEMHIKPTEWMGIIAGGIVFGIGMSALGYCPGTSIAACGEGAVDARFGVLGMLFGAGVYVALFDWLDPFVKSLGSLGKVSIPEVTSTSPWLWIAILGTAGIAALIFKRRNHGISV